MLSVCLIFLYVLLTAYLSGFFILSLIGGLCRKAEENRNRQGRKETAEIKKTEEPGAFCHVRKGDSYLMAGLVTVTVYAQFFSLIYKVGLLANLLLLTACAVIAVVFRKKLKEELIGQYRSLSRGERLFRLFLFFLFAYGTSRGMIHYDTGLYHAQSIRWIEEYGIVKGLGNLHCRLAYNSAAFSLSALYSFAFLGGQSYHCMAGFFGLLLAGVCSEINGAWHRKGLWLSDMARLMGIYYLLMIYDEMISPASDYFMVLTVFYIIIRYLDLTEREEDSWIPYGLLCLVCVYTMSLKLSAAFIVILAIKPAAMMIKEKKGREIVGFLGLGILIILPYFIRNVVISGWLVYPFTGADLFHMDYKIPKGIADYDAKEIQVWGRGIRDVTRYGEPVWKWIGDWFSGQGRINKLFILADGVAIPVSVVMLINSFVKRQEKRKDVMLALLTVNLSFLFWLLSAPLIRYGCVYVWLSAPLTFGALALWLIKDNGKGRVVWRGIYVVLAIAAVYKLWTFGREVTGAFSWAYFINQKDYENYEADSYEIEGKIFYCPTEGDRIGYAAFPSSPTKAEITLRGKEIGDGFRYKGYEERIGYRHE